MVDSSARSPLHGHALSVFLIEALTEESESFMETLTEELQGRAPRTTARYGLRACRVGEADHPGPVVEPAPGTAPYRRACVRHAIQQLQTSALDPATADLGKTSEMLRASIEQPHPNEIGRAHV